MTWDNVLTIWYGLNECICYTQGRSIGARIFSEKVQISVGELDIILENSADSHVVSEQRLQAGVC